MSLRKKWLHIIEEGFKILMEDEATGYNQLTIQRKLMFLGITVSKSIISNVYTQKQVSAPYLKKIAEGFCEILRRELCLQYNDNKKIFEKTDLDCVRKIVPEYGEAKDKVLTRDGEMKFHRKGRLFIAEKTALIATAKEEVHEIGVRLKRFSEYFTTRSPEEYKIYVEQLLSKGVHFKCYLLDPDANAARFYFEDRAKILPKDKKSTEVIKEVINNLLDIRNEFQEKGYQGAFEIYTYANIPNNAFSVIDPFSANGKMLIQHYLYGLQRNLCPSMEFTKRGEPILFERYLTAFNSILENAKKRNTKYPT